MRILLQMKLIFSVLSVLRSKYWIYRGSCRMIIPYLNFLQRQILGILNNFHKCFTIHLEILMSSHENSKLITQKQTKQKTMSILIRKHAVSLTTSLFLKNTKDIDFFYLKENNSWR